MLIVPGLEVVVAMILSRLGFLIIESGGYFAIDVPERKSSELWRVLGRGLRGLVAKTNATDQTP
jgi:hypothetical protein